jgi:hypothetical protein
MEFKGRLIKIMEPQTGQGRNGEWKKQEFVIEEAEGQYPKKACFSVWNDKINLKELIEGTILNVYFDIASREFNGKWYTDLTAYRADIIGTTTTVQSEPEKFAPEEDTLDKDDLPF